MAFGLDKIASKFRRFPDFKHLDLAFDCSSFIEIVVTPRRSTTKGKNTILFWLIWASKQLTFSPFLMNVFLLLFYETFYLSADMPEKNLVFLFFQTTSGCMSSMQTLKFVFLSILGLLCHFGLGSAAWTSRTRYDWRVVHKFSPESGRAPPGRQVSCSRQQSRVTRFEIRTLGESL